MTDFVYLVAVARMYDWTMIVFGRDLVKGQLSYFVLLCNGKHLYCVSSTQLLPKQWKNA